MFLSRLWKCTLRSEEWLLRSVPQSRMSNIFPRFFCVASLSVKPTDNLSAFFEHAVSYHIAIGMAILQHTFTVDRYPYEA